MASTKPVFNDVQEPRNLRGLSLSTTDSSLATQSSVTIAAGSEGVRHVADSFSFSVAANGGAVLTASTVRVSVIDGATAGTAATALTVEFDGAVTGAWTSLNLGYFDVGP